MTDISNKTFLVSDTGLYFYLARKIGEKAKKVYYHLQDSDAYASGHKNLIGKGFEEIERVDSFIKYQDKADCICFFDIYSGEDQEQLRKDGHIVFGNGMAEELELNRIFFIDFLKEYGLPIIKTYLADGTDDLEGYLKDKKDKYLKTSYYRGDFETYHYTSWDRFQSFLNDLKARIGIRSRDIEILVQNPIKSACEVGWDGYAIDDKYTEENLVGYEIKDLAYLGKVFKKTPQVLAKVNNSAMDYHGKNNCRGHFSTEIIIIRSGLGYFTDATERAPSPPSELMSEMDKKYAENIPKIAEGGVPKTDYQEEYGAEIILKSPWHEKHELCVEFPKDLEPFIKLKNATKRNGVHICIPNGNAGYFGAAIGFASSVKQAIQNVLDVVKEIGADELKIDKYLFNEAMEEVEAGAEFGIEF